MATTKAGVVAVTGMVMVVFAVALVIPPIQSATQTPQTNSFTQFEGERIVVTGSISSKAVTITGAGGNVNASIVNDRTGETKFTGTLQEGDTVNVTISNQWLEVTIEDIVSDTEAVISYKYPVYLGYPENAEVLFNNITLVLIVVTLISVMGVMWIVGKEVQE